MTIAIHELERIIKQSFPDADIKIHDLAGDDDHYHLKINSKCFLGKTKIEQHKMVYIALFTIIRTDRNMLLACYSHKHISYRIRTIIRKAIKLWKVSLYTPCNWKLILKNKVNL